jgi:hypothetical protein
MAKKSDQAAASRETASAAGAPTGFLAEEEHLDRTALLRLGAWAVTSVAAVIVAVVASQSSMKLRRDQIAAADLARQSQQIQSLTRESANEARRLASAIDTLNGDRDRLFSRMSALEQGLDSVTGSIARQSVAAAAPQPLQPVSTSPLQPVAQIPGPASVTALASPPVAAPVATAAPTEKPKAEAKAPDPAPAPKATAPATSTPSEAPAAAPPIASKSMTAQPVVATGKPIEPEPSAKPVAATPTVAPVPGAVVSAPVAMGPPAPAVVASKPMIGPPAPTVVASVPPADHAGADAAKPSSPPLIVKRTEFGVDVGGANSVGGLRALWRGLLRTRSNAALRVLQPIIVIKEGSNGLGMQLRLVAGPLKDAAAAARICAAMTANKRPCETAVFDGQRLEVKVEESAAAVEAVSGKSEPDKSDLAKSDPAKSDPAKSDSSKPDSGKPVTETAAAAKPASARYRHNYPKRVVVEEPPKPEPTTLSSFFGRRSAPTQ